MRIIVVLILLSFGLVTEGKTQRLNDAKTQSKDSATLCLCDSASYYESQIRLADSLYKNYLPQYNFKEVKTAMEFFDNLRPSTDNSQRTTDFVHRIFPNKRQRTICTVPEPVEGTTLGASTSPATAYTQNVDSCPLSVDFICAKAHYYHAVGLTEKDDIVGACEHYLIALEIMEKDDLIKRHKDAKTQRRKVFKKQRNDEKTLCGSVTLRLCDSNKEDYEKIRFVALIYTRLGRLFLNENYCDLAIAKYSKALKYVEMIDEKIFKADLLKFLGNSCQLSNNADSALYYYNESLKTSSDISNKLDINKSIAQIMFFNKGKRDSAYVILKNNFNKISKENVKYSYHFTLGNMFYNDKAYDSALYYLEKSLDNGIITQKLSFTTTLSAIYDSLGNYEKKAYYDNLSSKLFKNYINKGIDKTQLQVLYDNYNKRRTERERITAKAKIIRLTITISMSVVVLSISLIMFIRYKHKRHSYILSEEINVKEKRIRDNEFKFSLIDGKIKSKNMELQRKEEEIRLYQNEIAELRSRMESKKDNIKEYNQSEICMKILNEISELSKSGKNTSELQALRQDEFAMLLQSAKLHLSTFLKNTSDKYPTLKKEDFYYLCLVIINLNDKQIASLFGLSYEAIRKRKNKIATVLGVQNKDNFYNNIMELL